jgi:hypothetical protein
MTTSKSGLITINITFIIKQQVFNSVLGDQIIRYMNFYLAGLSEWIMFK